MACAIASLSPGERTRVGMALLQARGNNLIVLDEPTNHLDLEAIEQLEQALKTFDGTFLLVTHDRRMLDNVRLTRHWHVESGQLREIAADWFSALAAVCIALATVRPSTRWIPLRLP